jgi:hypothetical protein
VEPRGFTSNKSDGLTKGSTADRPNSSSAANVGSTINHQPSTINHQASGLGLERAWLVRKMQLACTIDHSDWNSTRQGESVQQVEIACMPIGS